MPRGQQPSVSMYRAARLLSLEPRGLWNYAIAKRLGIDANTCIGIMKRLEAAGWLSSEWERRQPIAPNRPRRLIYKMTDIGRVEFGKLTSFMLSTV